MAELRDAGCVGFSQADAPIADNQVLMRALQYATTFGFCVWLRAAGPEPRRAAAWPTTARSRRGWGLPAIPVCAETVALSTILILARETGARIHLCRLSSAEGVELVRAAKARGHAGDLRRLRQPRASERDGHRLLRFQLQPGAAAAQPARPRCAARSGLADGTIDAICSDHTPVDDDAKQLPFAEAEPGATGLELLLPLTLKWAREARHRRCRWRCAR